MSWVFTGLMRRALAFERKHTHRLDQAYARWRKEYRKRQGRHRVQERKLLGSQDRQRNNYRDE